MLKTLSAVLGISVGAILLAAGCQVQKAPTVPEIKPQMGQRALAEHPASRALARLFPDASAKPPSGFVASKMMRRDYLELVEANVDFYKQHQNGEGAIIDPVQGHEIQYSTPAFALSAATLVVEKKRQDLFDPAVRAMTFATHALANHTTANFHADFYIPMLMHARRILMNRVPRETLEAWDADFRTIIPETHYNDHDARANWNIVQIDGETMRRKNGLVATSQATSQPAYVERCLDIQEKRFTKFGMYTDPNMPLAYDAFPRLWMEDMMAEGAYDGAHAQQIRDFLMLGGLSSLLMISPTGEWACGGRSAHHQWNEAENIVIFEINASKWHQLGRDDIAGAMKRSAHLAYESMKRWQRPSGEMWIVKNRAEPDTRLGYESYSSHSQYNLLPMAMLCIAYGRADDSIKERPAPCEVGGFVFDVRDKFHKVFANAGGMYVEIDTAADPEYNSTGLQRVQKKGVPLSPLSDTTAARRHYGPTTNKTVAAMSPTIEWSRSAPTTRPAWTSLADFGNGVEPKPVKGEGVVESVDLHVDSESPQSVAFTLRYHLHGAETATVEEQYVVTPGAVDGAWRVDAPDITQLRVLFPALVNDGAHDLGVNTQQGVLEEHRDGGVLRFEIVNPPNVLLRREGPAVPCHNGLMRAVVGEVSRLKSALVWRITLENERT
jgi:hypothetical protein